MVGPRRSVVVGVPTASTYEEDKTALEKSTYIIKYKVNQRERPQTFNLKSFCESRPGSERRVPKISCSPLSFRRQLQFENYLSSWRHRDTETAVAEAARGRTTATSTTGRLSDSARLSKSLRMARGEQDKLNKTVAANKRSLKFKINIMDLPHHCQVDSAVGPFTIVHH